MDNEEEKQTHDGDVVRTHDDATGTEETHAMSRQTPTCSLHRKKKRNHQSKQIFKENDIKQI